MPHALDRGQGGETPKIVLGLSFRTASVGSSRSSF
jgi:hypothetical protein